MIRVIQGIIGFIHLAKFKINFLQIYESPSLKTSYLQNQLTMSLFVIIFFKFLSSFVGFLTLIPRFFNMEHNFF